MSMHAIRYTWALAERAAQKHLTADSKETRSELQRAVHLLCMALSVGAGIAIRKARR
jgi:hypothetical protein